MERLDELLASHPVAQSSETLRLVLDRRGTAPLSVIDLERDETLTWAGSLDNRLFVVLDGRLEVVSASGVRIGRAFGPGDVCGEVGFLTGMPRSATINATSASTVVAITGGVDAPDIPELRELAGHRLRAAMLVDVLTEHFAVESEEALTAFTEAASIGEVESGEQLFDDSGHQIVIVLLGTFRVESADGVIARASRGEILGEMSWLNGSVRVADVVATKRAVVARFQPSEFESLALRHPAVLLSISRTLAGRLSRDPIFRMAKPPRPLSLAVIAGSPAVDVDTLANLLADHLPRSTVVTPDRIERALSQPGATEAPPGSPQGLAVDTWLDLEEPQHEMTFCVGDSSRPEWNRRIVRQADRVILVLDVEQGPDQTDVERSLAPELRTSDVELVLLHRPSTERPDGTRAWLSRRQPARHHHIRQGNSVDIARTARRLAGLARGLVLGGGGARGFASIGVGLALESVRYGIDVFGGTSMGALVGAGLALHGAEFMVGMADRHGSKSHLHDPTLPITSVFASRQVTVMLQDEYGDVLIEDMWTPVFTVATNLSTAEEVIIDTGPLWEAVRASIAIPGVFSPISRDGDLLVDGGIMNNLPIDVMRSYCEQGPVLAVNVSPRASNHHWDIPPHQSGWKLLANRLNPFQANERAPSIAGTVLRSLDTNSVSRARSHLDVAELVIQPDVKEYSILDWDSHAAIIEIGRREGRQAIEEFLTNQS